MQVRNLVNKLGPNTSSATAIFLSVMALLVVALVGLSWLLLDQDRALQETRTRERVDDAVAELRVALSEAIATQQARLTDIADVLGSGGGADIPAILDSLRGPLAVIHFSAAAITVQSEQQLRYLTAIEPVPRAEQIVQADRLEYQAQDFPEAIRLLQSLALSSDQHLRASALVRLGRISRRLERMNEALNYYAELITLDDQLVGAIPVAWLGLYSRCSIFEADNRMDELGAETAILVSTLIKGTQHVSASTYSFYVDEVKRWANLAGRPESAAELAKTHVLSEMASRFLDLWGDWQQGNAERSGIRITGIDREPLLGIWTAFDMELVAGMLPLSKLHSASLSATTNRFESQGIGWRIADASGNVLLSSRDEPSGFTSLGTLVSGGMLLNVATFVTPRTVPDAADINRRQLLVGGLSLIFALILISTYFISRSLRREAEVSRLQSEFVAAVSHEFRTPLTSIRQLTEMLASGRVKNQDKFRDYLLILDKESKRLQRLVEGLLDFGRMEAGAQPYQPERLDCAALLGDIVDVFRAEHGLIESALSVEVMDAPYVMMDSEAFTRAIWNLLDNAVKYSADVVNISVAAWLQNGKVQISVTDTGVGLAPEESARIFDKFVRGSAAQATNAKGTGLGLAMVRKIVESHGGSIEARNIVGEGAVFTITLEPAENL